MFSGSNRKLFRKPGLARQAVGILASSGDLANTVQQQAVPGFANGGDVNVDLYRPFSGQGITGGSLPMRDVGYADATQSQKYMMRDLIRPGLEMPGGNTLTQKLYALAQDAYRRGDKQLGDNYMNQIIAAREVGAERGIDVDPKPTSQLLYEAYETGAQDVMGIGERKAAERMANLKAGQEQYRLSPQQAGFDERYMQPGSPGVVERGIDQGIAGLQSAGQAVAANNTSEAELSRRAMADVFGAVGDFVSPRERRPSDFGTTEMLPDWLRDFNRRYVGIGLEEAPGSVLFKTEDKKTEVSGQAATATENKPTAADENKPTAADENKPTAADENKPTAKDAPDPRARLVELLLEGKGIAGGVPKKDRDIAAKGIADQLDMSIKEAKELTKQDSFWNAVTAFGLGLAAGEGEGFMRDAAKAAMGAFDFYNKDRKAEEELAYTRAVDRLKLNMQEEELALTERKILADERQGDIVAQAKLIDALYPRDKSTGQERLIQQAMEIINKENPTPQDKARLELILLTLDSQDRMTTKELLQPPRDENVEWNKKDVE